MWYCELDTFDFFENFVIYIYIYIYIGIFLRFESASLKIHNVFLLESWENCIGFS